MEKITPCLWFNGNAEEAVKFYASVFRKSKIRRIARFGKEGFKIHGGRAGTVLTIEFELNGQTYVALNGGPQFKFNEAVSFQVFCKTQKEIDYYWTKLSAGGDPNARQCGWLKDKYGLSWQIIPKQLGVLTGDKNPAKANAAMQAMLKMKKIIVADLQKAYDQK